MSEFDISKLSGFLKSAAEKIDQAANKNGKIDGIEFSIFKHDANNLKASGKITAQEYNSIFGAANNNFDIQDNYVCAQDNTYVAQKHVPIIETNRENTTKNIKEKFEKINYKNHPKYEQTLALVKKRMDKNNSMDKAQGGEKYNEHAEYVTKIVIEKCQKYNIEDLIPVVAEMLGVESGGYVFNDEVMVHKGSKYKGVMQCDLTTCLVIYGEGRGEYDHKRYCKQDESRINELKSKYPTAKDLYNAIQHDAELGLEVGIMALKIKIAANKGSVSKGIQGYCGNQYRCKIPGVPTKIDIRQTA